MPNAFFFGRMLAKTRWLLRNAWAHEEVAVGRRLTYEYFLGSGQA